MQEFTIAFYLHFNFNGTFKWRSLNAKVPRGYNTTLTTTNPIVRYTNNLLLIS